MYRRGVREEVLRAYRSADPKALRIVSAKVIFETKRTEYKRDIQDAIRKFKESVPMAGEWDSYAYAGMMKYEFTLNAVCYPARANRDYITSQIEEILRSHPIDIWVDEWNAGKPCTL